MLKLQIIHGKSCPVIICDACNQRINNAEEGIVIYNKPREEGVIFDPLYVHKGDCDKQLSMHLAESKIKRVPYLGITQYIGYLLYNLQLSAKDIENYPIDL